MTKLLDDMLVLDFSQFLSGPSAGLRLADMGARVIKIERPGVGDICRELYVSDTKIEGGESTIFHAINRNKESYSADIKNDVDLRRIRKLIKKAAIVIHNFRPGVMERVGLGYGAIKEINPSVIYGEISGYGDEGEWKDLPGQDLLLQSVSGLTYLSGNNKDQPVPMGVAVADILAGTHLVQGILAALYQRLSTGEGSLVQVSMFESLLDFQFEVLTCFYNDGFELPVRNDFNNGHTYIAAPYGIYKTADGFIALAMGSVTALGALLGADMLSTYTKPAEWFSRRDEIKIILQEILLVQTTNYWLSILEPADIWCADVYDYDRVLASEAYKLLQMEQWVVAGNKKIKTTRCPARVDGELLLSTVGAPMLGEHNAAIDKEFDL